MEAPAGGAGEVNVANVDLPVDELAARRARRMVADLLAAWHLDDPALLDDAQLAVSELVTNAYLHGASGIALELEQQGDAIVLAVRDGSAVVPRPRVAEPGAENGRGLAILAAVTEDWGVEQEQGGGKRVWARLRTRS